MAALDPGTKAHCVLRLSTSLWETTSGICNQLTYWEMALLTATKPFRIDSLILNNNENVMKPLLFIPKDPSKHQFHPIICLLRTLVSPL